MSEENVEIARQAVRTFNERDVDGYQALFAPDAEIVPLRAALEDTVYRGPDVAHQFFTAADEAWDALGLEIAEIREVGDRLLLGGRFRGRGRGSGIDLEIPLWAVMAFRDGKIASLRVYTEREQALEAAGLSE